MNFEQALLAYLWISIMKFQVTWSSNQQPRSLQTYLTSEIKVSLENDNLIAIINRSKISMPVISHNNCSFELENGMSCASFTYFTAKPVHN